MTHLKARGAESVREPSPEAGGSRQTAVDAVYRSGSRRIFATLIRILGDFELAEGALQD